MMASRVIERPLERACHCTSMYLFVGISSLNVYFVFRNVYRILKGHAHFTQI